MITLYSTWTVHRGPHFNGCYLKQTLDSDRKSSKFAIPRSVIVFSAIAKCKSELNRKLFETISGQVGGGDLQPRGQGQRRLHLARRVLRTETRRTLKIQDSKNSSFDIRHIPKLSLNFPLLILLILNFLPVIFKTNFALTKQKLSQKLNKTIKD